MGEGVKGTVGIVLAINRSRWVLTANTDKRGPCLPGGKVRMSDRGSHVALGLDELPRESAARELFEETGYKAYGPMIFLARGVSTTADFDVHVFLVTGMTDTNDMPEYPRTWASWMRYSMLLKESPFTEFYLRVIGESVDHLRSCEIRGL